MPSIRHMEVEDDPLLDAARECVLSVGLRRTTLTDVARRAGVSRMTLYRRWPDMQTLLADVMTREWAGVARDLASAGAGDGGPAAQALARTVVRTVRALRSSQLFRKIVEVDPELLLPYLLDRRGRTQEAMLALLVPALRAGQRDGSIRDGDARALARAVLLSAHGFALSVQTMTDGVAAEQLEAEHTALLQRYLEP